MLTPVIDDPFDLARFADAQRDHYRAALAELRAGRKTTHWMWFFFPQFDGLGTSPRARRYAIRGLDEARAYLEHAGLGARGEQFALTMLKIRDSSARQILGSPDDLKLRSSATLFALISPPGSVFERVLDRYFEGERDPETLRLIEIASRQEPTGAPGSPPASPS